LVEPEETMGLTTAAKKYGVVRSTLENWCGRGKMKGMKVGNRWYVTAGEMERVFRGTNSPLPILEPKPEAIVGKLTLWAIAVEYGISPPDLRVFCKDKRLKAQKLGKCWYVDRTEVERFFKGEVPVTKPWRFRPVANMGTAPLFAAAVVITPAKERSGYNVVSVLISDDEREDLAVCMAITRLSQTEYMRQAIVEKNERLGIVESWRLKG
jgi:hypothetical protein